MTYGETLRAFRVYQRARGLSENTIWARQYMLQRWGGWTNPWSAQRADVVDFLGSRPLSPSSRHAMHSHLHRFYVWAIAEGLCKHDPTEHLEPTKRPRRLPRPIPEQDFLLAVDAAADPVLRAWLLLAGYGGLRCVELARLRWANVDLARRTAHVRGKGDRERTIPLHVDTVQALLDLPRDGPWIAGRPLRPARVSQLINRYLHGLGVSATAHQLRHRAATNAYAGEGDILAVQELLGHANVATTQIYTKLDVQAVRRAVDAMPTLSDLRRSLAEVA